MRRILVSKTTGERLSKGLQLKLRGPLRPVVRFLKYFSLNTFVVDGPRDRLVVGSRCGLSNAIFNTSSGSIIIDDHVAFGYNVMVLTGRHQFKDGQRASLVRPPGSHWGGGPEEVPETGFDIHIGEGCWIASGAILSGGVSIGRNSIVAAGAVVTRSFPPNSLVAGVPARVIGRTDDGSFLT